MEDCPSEVLKFVPWPGNGAAMAPWESARMHAITPAEAVTLIRVRAAYKCRAKQGAAGSRVDVARAGVPGEE